MTHTEPLPDFDLWWNYDQPAETEQKFRELVPQAARVSPGRQAELLTQIARAQGLQRQFTQAHQTLDDAYSLLTDEFPRARVRVLLERGRVFNSAGDAARAGTFFSEAWDAANAAGEDALAVDAAHMIAIIAHPDHRMEWNLKALQLAETSPDPRAQRWQGSLANNIGWTYHDQGNYTEALRLFEKALTLRQQQGDAEGTRIATWTVARALRSLGRVAEALTTQKRLYEQGTEAGRKDPYVLEELGECLILLDRNEEAHPFFFQAYEILSKDPWLTEHEPDRLARLHHFSQEKGIPASGAEQASGQ